MSRRNILIAVLLAAIVALLVGNQVRIRHRNIKLGPATVDYVVTEPATPISG